MEFIAPIPFREALEKIGARGVIGAKLNSGEWGALPVALRERAFFSSQIESARFLQRARDSLTEFLSGARETVVSPSGKEAIALATGSRQEFVKQMQAFAIAEGMGPVAPEDAGTIKDIRSQQRLELIHDVQTRQAQDFGYWQQGQDPDVLEAFPAQRFIRVLEVQQERDSHAPYEGQVALKSDLDFWLRLNEDFGVPWGPWGWGCGHDVEDVDRAEAEGLGLIEPGAAVEPVVKDFNERLEASTKGLDPDLEGLLRDEFGERVAWTNAGVRWKT